MISLLLAFLSLAAPRAGAQAAISTAAASSMTTGIRNRGAFAPARGLIHPLVDIDVANAWKDPWVVELQRKTENLIGLLKKDGLASDVSVEFVSAEKAAQFDIDIELKYKPASMIKVPIMIAYLKKRELDPKMLTRRLQLLRMPAIPFSPEFPPKRRLVVGKKYSIDELMQAMIARSDNDAAYTLIKYMRPEELTQVYEDLGVHGPDTQNPGQLVTVRDISAFHRVLYVAGYLSWERSQQALEYLIASEFKDGLVALLPSGTVVAHKFGEAASVDNGLTQIHDCGVVYHPKGPYILCVLTRGSDQHKQAAAIARISKLIYDEADRGFTVENAAPAANPAK